MRSPTTSSIICDTAKATVLVSPAPAEHVTVSIRQQTVSCRDRGSGVGKALTNSKSVEVWTSSDIHSDSIRDTAVLKIVAVHQ